MSQGLVKLVYMVMMMIRFVGISEEVIIRKFVLLSIESYIALALLKTLRIIVNDGRSKAEAVLQEYLLRMTLHFRVNKIFMDS